MVRININKCYLMFLMIYCLGVLTVRADDSKKYLVIKLDDFSAENMNYSSGFSGAVLGKGRVTNNQEVLPVAVKAYPLGKPLQVMKSYVPGNSDEVDAVSRYISDTTSRYVPEFLVGARNSFSSAEYIDTMFLSIHYPVSNDLSFGIGVIGGVFDLIGTDGEPAISCGVAQVAFEAKQRINTEIDLYGAVVLGSTHSVVTAGLRGRVNYVNRSGVELKIFGNLWTPWADNTIGAHNNGRSSGLRAEAVLPLSSRFSLNLYSGVDWRYTARSAFEVESYEGVEFSGGGRLTWDFFKREYRKMPSDFISREYLDFDNVSSKVGLFASLQASKYTGRNDDTSLIPVTDEQLDQRLGLSAAYAFNSHFGATAELYVGYDPARNIDFGKLYGFNTRVVYIPTAKLRVYGEFAMDSELATGLVEGRTWYYGAGVNYKF